MRSRNKIHRVIYAAGPSIPINLAHAALPILREQIGGSLTAVTTTQHSRHVPLSASRQARYISGDALTVDGGWRL